jgi:DNA primase
VIEAGVIADIKRHVSLVAIAQRANVALRKRGREWVACCPFHAEKNPSFGIVEEEGFFHCFGCGAHGDVIELHQRLSGLSFADAVAELREGNAPARAAPDPVKIERDRTHRIAKAERVWSGVVPLAGTPGEAYLVKHRGIEIAWPATVAFYPALDYWDEPATPAEKPRLRGKFPAVVAMMENVDGDFVGVWRIYVAGDGMGKAAVPIPKRAVGLTKGAAIRLGPPAAHQLIGEGLENTGAAHELSGQVVSPWCAPSAGHLAVLELTPLTEWFLIMSDNDKPHHRQDGSVFFPGQEGAQAAARRWMAQGRKGEILTPTLPDANDQLLFRKGRLKVGGEVGAAP